jgi:hypothetical protein
MTDQPDIEIGAVVKAKRMRFHKKPETEVRVEGDGGSGSERENLPETVEPGVTYRDVTVRWRAAARVEEKQIAQGGSDEAQGDGGAR